MGKYFVLDDFRSSEEDRLLETCIHCGSSGHSSQFLDGVCYACQRQGRLGRQALERKKINERILQVIIVGGGIALFYRVLTLLP